MLISTVAETLRASVDETLAARCFSIIERLHDYLPPAVRLEERSNFLSRNPIGNAREIAKLLRSALIALMPRNSRSEVALTGPGARYRGCLRRCGRASTVRCSQSRVISGSGETQLRQHLPAEGLPPWVAAVLPANFPTAELGISGTALGLLLDPAPTRVPRITLPATNPRVVEIRVRGSTQMITPKAPAHSVPLPPQKAQSSLSPCQARRLGSSRSMYSVPHRRSTSPARLMQTATTR